MENKTAAMLVLAIVASLVVTAGAAYAMGRQTSTTGGYTNGSSFRSGMGPSMMGGASGHWGGMMGAWNGTSPMYQRMSYCWNATNVP